MVWKVRKMMGKATLASRSMSLSRTPHRVVGALAFTCPGGLVVGRRSPRPRISLVELQTKISQSPD